MITTIYSIFGVLGFLLVLDFWFRRRYDPKEPPTIAPSIPLIGHLIGFAKYATGYAAIISVGRTEEIFAINFFSFRIYIINSRHLIPAIQKNKSLSFAPFQKQFTDALTRPSKHTLDLFDTDHIHEITRVQLAAWTPGKDLDHQNVRVADTLMLEMEKLSEQISMQGSAVADFFEWTRYTNMIAATNGIYGSANPMRDPEIWGAFLGWYPNIMKHLSGYPNFLLKESAKARDKFLNSFSQYLQSDHSDAGEVIFARERLYTRDQVPVRDMASSQALFTVGLIGNLSPTVFWTVWDIFSRPQLLVDIREELERVAVTRHNNEKEQIFELDLAALKSRCPLLLSAHEETQRTRFRHANVRKAMEDTVLDGRHWLKKGSMIIIPNKMIHNHPEIWGANAKEYNPRRFTSEKGLPIGRSALSTSYAFLAWGTAPTLCPARQFAATQILLFTALMVLRFEVDPVYGEGQWKEPKLFTGALAVIEPPNEKMDVRIRNRRGVEGLWRLKMGESKTRVPIASG
ncbi:hypothetical protein TWF569_003577 [Orbilia oligospora]|uniref:Cytochrome P450 n=1 Tax=Orbilia oligospora TaxID=2813651 RepID=A0A7C8JKA9_ORBOL|nr:hypothetical protein TWF706_003357 [Orbilia oligospora]KAF3080205.1 hypothetical protein TWF102_002424 [Orbilia oligospora]KAF3097564.1 hypothetical protein TWF103_009499 [Orbilia oligospora]KAF3119828.1 hypothetical protein TWF569_003577 [Orbilia oligospora]KAF3124205.1 hypothetical protein TWF703_000507 [Orbilia oligospora]